MTNNQVNLNEIYSFMDQARFDETRIANSTVAILTSLKNDSVVGVKINPKAEELWIQLTQKEPLNSAEREVIDRAIRALQEGTASTGQSYQAMAYGKKTAVEFTPSATFLTPQSGSVVTIPNHPVPPPARVTPRRYQEWIDPWVVGNFDISKGDLVVTVPYRDKDTVWTGKYSRINISGLDAVKGVALLIVKTSPQWPAIRKDKTSCKGLAFMDLWTTACATCPLHMYLALHNAVVTKCLTQCNFVVTKETKDLPAARQKTELRVMKAPLVNGLVEEAYPLGTVVALKKTDIPEEEANTVKEYITKTKHIPYMVAGPVKTLMNFFVVSAASETVALAAYHRTMKLLGGKRRGVGCIAASWNFGARVDETWREVYLLAAMADNIAASIDIRVSSGAFPMMLVYCKRRADVTVKVLLSDDQRPITKGMTAADRQYITMERRLTCTYVGMRETASLPELDPKKPGEASEKIADMYALWEAELPKGDFIVYTQVFAAKAFDTYYIRALKSSHDLSALVTNVKHDWDIPTATVVTSDQFHKKAIGDMRALVTWWHSPESTYSELSETFVPDLGTLSWTKEEGFTMNPEFNYGEEEDHQYDVYSDSNEWTQETGESDTTDGEDDPENREPEVVKMTPQPVVPENTLNPDVNFSGIVTNPPPQAKMRAPRPLAAQRLKRPKKREEVVEEEGTKVEGTALD